MLRGYLWNELYHSKSNELRVCFLAVGHTSPSGGHFRERAMVNPCEYDLLFVASKATRSAVRIYSVTTSCVCVHNVGANRQTQNYQSFGGLSNHLCSKAQTSSMDIS